MILKTYRARSMGDALAEVKRDLGKEAVILHTRAYRVGGWLGFGGKPMVEITASDGVNVVPRDKRARPGPAKPEPRPAAVPAAAARAYGMPAAAPVVLDSAAFALETKPVPEISAAARGVVEAITAPRERQADGLSAAVESELASIRRLVGQVLQCSRQTALKCGPAAAAAAIPGATPDALFNDYLKLLEGEVAADLAEEIIGLVRDELSPAELADHEIVRQTILRHIASMIPAEGDVPRLVPPRDGRPLTIALVGPTGVGKTTTVAKLAAAYKLRHGKKVGLVTTDTYRIAAVEQLRTYAEIIGLPLKVAMSGSEMASVLESLRECDVVLIDTAGRSQRDGERLEELKRFIAAARPHQTHLVLASTASEAVLLESAERFGQVSPDRVIFTKLDEAVNFGVLVTVAKRIALKLSYVTTGQEVPDHIEIGSPDRIARLLLEGSGGGSKAR